MPPLPRRGLVELSLTAASALLLPAFRPRQRQDAHFEVVVLRDVMVAMRDGVRLATDVYVPARNGVAVSQRFPVILERTPYGKTADSRSERTLAVAKPKSRAEVAEFFVRRGYVVICQDCRGRYHSEGEFVKYLSDGNDGFDTCAWIVRQPWCNGRIGTMGLSYAVHTQGALGSGPAGRGPRSPRWFLPVGCLGQTAGDLSIDAAADCPVQGLPHSRRICNVILRLNLHDSIIAVPRVAEADT